MAIIQRERLVLLAADRARIRASARDSNDLLASVRAGAPITDELQDRFQQLYHRYSWASKMRLWSIIEMLQERKDLRRQDQKPAVRR